MVLGDHVTSCFSYPVADVLPLCCKWTLLTESMLFVVHHDELKCSSSAVTSCDRGVLHRSIIYRQAEKQVEAGGKVTNGTDGEVVTSRPSSAGTCSSVQVQVRFKDLQETRAPKQADTLHW